MRRDDINYLVVGGFVLVLFALLMLLLYQITGRTGPTDEYTVTYSNVAGIKYGTPVTFEGFQIGQVESVEPVREGGGVQFNIVLSVIEDWQIPADSVAVVVKSGLLSAVGIDIDEGKSATALEPGSELKGREAADLFAAVNNVAADLQSLSRESLRPMLDNLNKRIDQIGDDIHPILNDQVRVLLERLLLSADRLNGVLSIENLEHIRSMLANVDASSAGLRELMVEIEGTRAQLDELLVHTDGVVVENGADLRQSVIDLRKSLDAIARHVDAVTHHLEGSSRNMHEFSRQIRENPGLLLRGSAQQDEGEKQ